MSKITEYAEITSLDDDDWLVCVDVSDTSMAASGTTKKIKKSNVGGEKVRIAAVNNSTAGDFTFSTIPQTYDHLFLKGYIRSNDDGATVDNIFIEYNGLTTGYRRQSVFGGGGSPSGGTQPDQRICTAPADSSPANAYAEVEINIDRYSMIDFVKMAHAEYWHYATTSIIYTGQNVVGNDGLTTAITDLRIHTDNDPTDLLVGEFVLYGIKDP